jgi:hypothetical protein
MTPNLGLLDLLRYLALAVVWILAGHCLLRITGQKALRMTGWLISPALTHAFVAVALGMSAVLRAPIRNVAAGLWCAVLVLATVGLVFLLREANNSMAPGSVFKGLTFVLGVAVIVPMVLLLPYFSHGFGAYPGTTHPDAWSYTVYGAYLWKYPRLTDGGLSPAYQWAAHLSETRFVAAANLGWLATATREGDSQAAFGLLLALTAFTIGSTSAAVARVLGLPRKLLPFVAVGAGAGNWIAAAIWVSNLDNLIAVSFMPALAVLGLERTITVPEGRAFLTGLLAAATIYTYPELAAVCLFCSLLFFVDGLFDQSPRRPIISVFICALTVAVLVSPYAAGLSVFVRNQFGEAVSASPRPAEGVFIRILDPLHSPGALWGLGAVEDGLRPGSWLTNAVGVALLVLTLLGLGQLLRRRVLGPLGMLAVLVAGYGVFVWHYHYSYGAFKFILLGWWLAVVAVAFGIRECSRVHRLLTTIAVALALATISGSARRSVHGAITPVQPNIADFRAVRAVERFAHDEPVAIAVGNSTALHWAAYFLRDRKTRLIASSGYLATPHFQPSMLRAAVFPWNSLRLLLTEATDVGPVRERQHWKQLWRNDDYALWDTGDVGWAVVRQIETPYPTGSNLIWLGPAPTRLVATTNLTGVATVHADLTLSQALLPSKVSLRFLATDGEGARCEWTMTTRGTSFVVGLEQGDNLLTLTKTLPAEADVPLTPEADHRYPFLFGLFKPTLEFQAGSPDISASCPGRSLEK